MAELPSWPGFLPLPIAYTSSWQGDAGVETTTLQTGLMVQRRKFAGVPTPAPQTFRVTDAEANIIAAFADAHIGSEFTIELEAPGSFGARKAYRCRLLGFPEFAERAPGYKTCRLDLAITALDVPSLADLAVPGTEFLGADGQFNVDGLEILVRTDIPAGLTV